MRLVSYQHPKTSDVRFGFLFDAQVLDAAKGYAAAKPSIHGQLETMPSDILTFLRLGEAAQHEAHKLCAWFTAQHHAPIGADAAFPLDAVQLCSPIPRPVSMRDGYAFRQHVETARRNRGVAWCEVFDEIPIFYFTNHLSVTGAGDVFVEDDHLKQLDFELECAIVLGKSGKNIPAERADEYIYGLMVMNDWSARVLQMQEMQMNLGPAKGKDFATSLGPCIVTLDELHDRIIPTPKGNHYDLAMTTRINGNEVSRGNVKDMAWTFAQILERVSYGVEVHAGEVIGSGTCGTGCLLELNGSKVFNPPLWLSLGDTVECEIEQLGTLKNRIQHA
ncbi:MAG: fumarylacetoacetate hydrolase family protein [Candidatus Kapaibacterium sp.]|nr:MAG: fumarylacetoacetate hydrolase family protein [Candidatus Kapabacteria bacterium]